MSRDTDGRGLVHRDVVFSSAEDETAKARKAVATVPKGRSRVRTNLGPEGASCNLQKFNNENRNKQIKTNQATTTSLLLRSTVATWLCCSGDGGESLGGGETGERMVKSEEQSSLLYAFLWAAAANAHAQLSGATVGERPS